MRLSARAARAAGSRSPPAIPSRIARAVLVRASDDTVLDSLARAPSRSFSSRCRYSRGPVADQLQPVCGSGRAAPGSPGAARTKGAKDPHLGQPGDPLRVEPVGLGAGPRAAAPATGWPAARPARRPPAGSTRSASSPTSPPSTTSSTRLASSRAASAQIAAAVAGRCPRPATGGGRRRGPAVAAACTTLPSPSRRPSRPLLSRREPWGAPVLD